jgi:hypothetical protein
MPARAHSASRGAARNAIEICPTGRETTRRCFPGAGSATRCRKQASADSRPTRSEFVRCSSERRLGRDAPVHANATARRSAPSPASSVTTRRGSSATSASSRIRWGGSLTARELPGALAPSRTRRALNRPKRPEHGGDNQCEADGKLLDHASNCERQGRVLSRGKCDHLAGLPFCPQVARAELCKLP